MTPTPEQVAQWAREAWQSRHPTNAWLADCQPLFERLVTRAMAEQAEADAKLCDSLEYEFKSGANCAAAIRANAPKVAT